jgi:hypothetical protein
MKRFRQFYSNAGFSGVARSLIGLLAATFLLAEAIASGKGFYAAIATVAGLALGYLLQEFLTDHLRATKWVMNSILFAFLCGLWFIPDFRSLEAVRVYTGPVAVTYVGCYFWIHSHPLVLAGDRLAELRPALAEIEAAMAELDAVIAEHEAGRAPPRS